MSTAIGVIQGFHAVIGGLRNEGHWFVNDADAHRYGQAMANAARHFPLKTTQKAIDVSMLIIVAGSIETPRIVRSIQLARQGPQQPPRPAAPVFQFVRPNAQPPQDGLRPFAPSQTPPPPSPTTPPPAAPTAPAGNSGAPSDFAIGPQDGGGFGGDAAE